MGVVERVDAATVPVEDLAAVVSALLLVAGLQLLRVRNTDGAYYSLAPAGAGPHGVKGPEHG
jgi:hypothetical protein